ncbi:MAG: asparagine synthase (glutamine-hydrolyzing) [Sphingobacteriales bacterium]|nr:MAG: asparagine synthase (glutamine-hydrolyzing) [Sphingobacteriales bacterium]
MCGISGYYRPDLVTDEKHSLDDIEKTLRHRGPDNFGTYYDGSVGFAHNRLSLLDLSSNGNQPFKNERCVFVYNGEVYNYLELKHKYLRNKDIQFVSGTDTEVLFYLLQYYPIKEFIHDLDGMFAFAYYDKLEKKMYLVRDKLGIKPLFYLKAPGGKVYFSSEMKSFFSVANLEMNDFRTLYSAYGVYDSADENTVFSNVFHVKPGHYIEINGTVKETCYFKLTDLIDPEYYMRQARKGEQELFEEFENTLSASITSMLMSDAPMGIFVSGGIDSSLIAALTTKSQKMDLFTANVVGKYSEVEDARALSRQLNLQLHEYEFREEYFTRDYVNCTWHMESPIITHVNAIPFSGVARLAHSKGVKAVLTGEGSDELFLGYPNLLTKRYNGLINGPANLVNWFYNKVPGLAKSVLKVNENRMGEALINTAKQFQRQRIKQDMNSLGHIPENERHDQYLSLRMMQEHLLSLLWRNDRMGMIASIESRFPFLGEQVIKFALNLPLKYKIGHTNRFYNYKHPFLIDKKIVRGVAQKHLNKHLVYKKKNGFPLKGIAHLRPSPSYFKGGILQTAAGLRDTDLKLFVDSLDSYTLGKFTSVETFHKLFVQRIHKDTLHEQFVNQVKFV